VTDDQVLDVEDLGGVSGVLVQDLACSRLEAATYTVGRIGDEQVVNGEGGDQSALAVAASIFRPGLGFLALCELWSRFSGIVSPKRYCAARYPAGKESRRQRTGPPTRGHPLI
jgi:hypothetical protein